ncbi:MAG: translation initiation factor IF-2, partial [Patescibacteria group bacterium]
RAPVVVVMGHVDHGKTKLLDAIRETNVMAGEAGGITQHIGAYQVEKKGRLITFIDTPGHEAFTAMRSRGARVADIAIIVVAADDGVQPQTTEVIKIVNAAKLPFVVAINKVDKPDINLDKVKSGLADAGLNPEEWGGKTICIPVSAKTGAGVDALLEMILLVAEMNKDKIAANPERLAVGSVIEAHIDKGEGPVATVLVQTGTLRRNDYLSIGNYLYGRVRAMRDWRGKNIEEAAPGTPVKILGFKVAPQVGDIFETPANPAALDKKAKTETASQADLGSTLLKSGGEESGRKELHLILKTDVLGSLEALIAALQKMETPLVAPEIIQKGLGNITDTDVGRAIDTGAQIFGFNVFATPGATSLAREKAVPIRIYKIIYDLLDAVHDELEKLLPKEIERLDLGKLKALAIFRTEKDAQIIGGVVIDGTISKDAKVELTRNGQMLAKISLLELQCGKQEVKEVGAGRECGMKIKTKEKIQIGDVLEFYKEETREIKL